MARPITTKTIRSPLHGSKNSCAKDSLQTVKSTHDQSLTCEPMTSKDLRAATSSPALAAGITPCNSQDGPLTDLFGQEVAPASRSVQRESAKGWPTPATCGPTSSASSRSVALQQSLESRSRQRMAAYGSPEYVLTWKHWDMASGPPICALRARGRRISDKDCSGWPTPNAIPETRGGLQTNPQKALERRQQGHALNLDDAACLVSGWATPTTRDHKDGSSAGTVPANGLLGRQVWSSPALTESTDASPPAKRPSLNPRFSLWLMGFPIAWALCAEQVTPLSRKSRRNSFKPSSKRKGAEI